MTSGIQILGLAWAPSAEDEGQVELRVTVDGEDLNEIARHAELPDATRDGQPEVAGGYAGLRAWAFDGPIAEHFLGSPDSHLYCGPDEKTVLIGCSCGEPGCWPLMARVEVGASEVRWSEFEQPHREGWSHEGLGPFVFEREQYVAALEAADHSRPD
jgi:hypothetical protein